MITTRIHTKIIKSTVDIYGTKHNIYTLVDATNVCTDFYWNAPATELLPEERQRLRFQLLPDLRDRGYIVKEFNLQPINNFNIHIHVQ